MYGGSTPEEDCCRGQGMPLQPSSAAPRHCVCCPAWASIVQRPGMRHDVGPPSGGNTPDLGMKPPLLTAYPPAFTTVTAAGAAAAAVYPCAADHPHQRALHNDQHGGSVRVCLIPWTEWDLQCLQGVGRGECVPTPCSGWPLLRRYRRDRRVAGLTLGAGPLFGCPA